MNEKNKALLFCYDLEEMHDLSKVGENYNCGQQ